MLPPSPRVYRANDMAPWGHMYVNHGLTETIKITDLAAQDARQLRGGRELHQRGLLLVRPIGLNRNP